MILFEIFEWVHPAQLSPRVSILSIFLIFMSVSMLVFSLSYVYILCHYVNFTNGTNMHTLLSLIFIIDIQQTSSYTTNTIPHLQHSFLCILFTIIRYKHLHKFRPMCVDFEMYPWKYKVNILTKECCYKEQL